MEAEAAKAEADYRIALEDVHRGSITAFSNVEALRALIGAAEARVVAAQEALRGTRLEVEAGVKPILAELDAERELIAAQAALLDGKGRLLIAAEQVLAIVGHQ